MLRFFTRKQLNLPPPAPILDMGLKGLPVHVYNSNEQTNPEQIPRYRARKERVLAAIAQEEALPLTRERAKNLELFRLELLELNRKLA